MTKRVTMASLMHETHSFVPDKTTLRDFRTLRGQELWQEEHDTSCLSGGLLVARERNWHVLPVISMVASPSGVVVDEVVEHWWQAFESIVAREGVAGIDGIWLNMHGAMVSKSLPGC